MLNIAECLADVNKSIKNKNVSEVGLETHCTHASMYTLSAMSLLNWPISLNLP